MFSPRITTIFVISLLFACNMQLHLTNWFTTAAIPSYSRIQTYLTNTNYTCNPNIDCGNVVAGSFVPDISSCHNYFICLSTGPTDQPLPCPDGQYFQHSSASCVDEINGECPNNCLEYPEGFCPRECSYFSNQSALHAVPDPDDCSIFYLCKDNGDEETFNCPDELPYFNGENCVAFPDQCCNICSAYCFTEEFIEIEDPCDCHSYYVCLGEVGKADPALRSICDPDYYFNEISQSCDFGNCTSICNSTDCV